MNQSEYPYWDSWIIDPKRKVNMKLPYGRGIIGSLPYGGKKKAVTSSVKSGPYVGGFIPPEPEPESELGFGKELFTPGFLGKAVADLFRSIRGGEPTGPTGAGMKLLPSHKPFEKGLGIPEGEEPTETKQIFTDEKGGKTTVTYKRAPEEVSGYKGAITRQEGVPVAEAPKPTSASAAELARDLGPAGEAPTTPFTTEQLVKMSLERSDYQRWMSDPQNRLLLAGIAQAFGGPGSWPAGVGKMQAEAAMGELYKEALGEAPGMPAYEGPTGYGIGPEFISNVLAQKVGAGELARKAGLEERGMGVSEREIALREEQAEVTERIAEVQIGRIRASTALDKERAKVAGIPKGVSFKVRSQDIFNDGTAWDVAITNRGEQFVLARSAVGVPQVTERNVANRVAALYVPKVREYIQRLSEGTGPLAERAGELIMADALSRAISDMMTGEASYTKMLELMAEFGMQDLMDQMRAEHKARLRGTGGVPAGEITEPEAYEGLIY